LSLKLGCIRDALALNIGGDSWEAAQVASAYAAAKSLGTNFKLFLSFDFTAMGCTLSNVVSLVNTYANHPNQFKYIGKTFISSYEGGCLGNAGWQSLKAQTNGYVMPFISGLEGKFPQWPALDSWYWLVRLFDEKKKI
jgi:glucan endo-1,3-alpha-glucosidase